MSRSSRPTPPATASAAVIAGFTLQQAKARTRSHPQDALAWKSLGYHQYRGGDAEQGRANLERSRTLDDQDPDTHAMLGLLEQSLGDDEVARNHFARALALAPNSTEANLGMSDVHAKAGGYDQAMACLDRLSPLAADGLPALTRRGPLLFSKHRYDEAEKLFRKLTERQPKQAEHWNSLGNALRSLGRLDEAYTCYDRATTLLPTDPVPRSNYLTSLHYDPKASIETILKASQDWGAMFTPDKAVIRPLPVDMSVNRVLRVGMISDGFRQHPVGAMTTPALEHLKPYGIELHAYTTSNVVDPITKRIMGACASWQPIAHLTDEALAQRIRDDGIDILIDLSGHNTGTRMRALTMEPAPVLVKWVGGLIGTTGVKAIDYLISDRVESPPGSDAQYTEKLIRMPDDYICYLPPVGAPDVAPLPALRNGYITFGCFNNPTKINPELLAQWAFLMHQVPNSRLLLKGGQFESLHLRDQITQTMASHGIDASRVRMDGHSRHADLLATYNEVDVALDPWPYSGGLTTCEAMLMGVPVVTLPGPTFAGRHSATHLVNAGMPELVVDDWDSYRARVLELVSDLQSLSTIRGHLRRILLASPICDGPRFARHLANGLRAIWQRYCEGKRPAALTFTPDGQPWFEDSDAPIVLHHPARPDSDPSADTFQFSFKEKIVTLDHGGVLVQSKEFASVSSLRILLTILLDPANHVAQAKELAEQGVIQHYHVRQALGDGKPATLYACLDEAYSGTLMPLPAEQQLLPIVRQGSSVLARLPIPTIRLDRIGGLESVDWLALDEHHDCVKILEGAGGLLSKLLVIHVRLLFLDIYDQQPSVSNLTKLLAQHGFRLLRMENARLESLFADAALKKAHPEARSQLLSGDFIFVPNSLRIGRLSDDQRTKLAFILHTIYRSSDLVHQVLASTDEKLAASYLTAMPLAPSQAEGKGNSLDVSDHDVARLHNAEHRLPLENYEHTTSLNLRSGTNNAPQKTKQKICVGIPLHNEEKYIEQALKSYQAQDIDSVQFFISDNASTDRTLEIVRDLVGNDSRFRIAEQATNIGGVPNCRFLFDNSDSDYFLWVVAHGFLSENYLPSLVARMEERPDISMACGLPYGINVENGKDQGEPKLVPSAIYDFSMPQPLSRYLESVKHVANCTILQSIFRRKNLARFEIRPTLSWDHVFISHLLWHGKLEYIPEAKCVRRYFLNRKANFSERISGKSEARLSRQDFFDYYAEDFEKLAKSKIPDSEYTKYAHEIQKTLKIRFL